MNQSSCFLEALVHEFNLSLEFALETRQCRQFVSEQLELLFLEILQLFDLVVQIKRG